jgi:hypothetical protein
VFEPPAEASAASHQHEGDGTAAEAQGPGAIAGQGFRHLPKPVDQPAHHHHRVEAPTGIAEEAIHAAGQGYK